MLKLGNLIKTNVWFLQNFQKLAIEIWFPFNFAKSLKGRHFVVGGSKNLKISTNTCFGVGFQKNVLSSSLLLLSVCYQDDLSDSERNDIASSAARYFNTSWFLYVKFSGKINLCRNIWLLENSKCQLLFFWNKTRQRGQNFQFLKGKLLGNAWPYGYDFWPVFRDLCEVSNKYKFPILFKYSKSHNNLNAKKCLKLNDP